MSRSVLIGFCLAMCGMTELLGDNNQPVMLVKMHRSVYNENIKIEVHTDGVLKKDQPIYVQARSYPLGVSTQSDPLRNMRENQNGTTILLILNGRIRLYLTNKDNNPMVEQKAYFKQMYRKYIPADIASQIQPGNMVINAIAINSFGESIKMPGANSTDIVDYLINAPADPALQAAVKKPYLLYNEPFGTFPANKPILLDFYLFNTDLQPQGYKAALYIDGKKIATLTEWSPYQIRNLTRGQHRIRLVLENSKGQEVPHPFVQQENTIYVK